LNIFVLESILSLISNEINCTNEIYLKVNYQTVLLKVFTYKIRN